MVPYPGSPSQQTSQKQEGTVVEATEPRASDATLGDTVRPHSGCRTKAATSKKVRGLWF
jgi:hypothetical protein